MKKAFFSLACMFLLIGNIAFAQKQLENPCMSSQRFVSQQKNCIDERENETSTIFIKGNSLKSPHSELISVPLQDQKLTSSIQLSPLSAIKQPVLKTNSGAEIWVNVTYAPGMSAATDRSISSFSTTTPKNLTPLIKGNFMFYNGIGLVDGKLYAGYNAVSKDKKYTPTLYTIDTNTWKLIGAEVLNDYSLMSFETAMATDGTIYGEFYSVDGKSKEIGIIDYPNKTRSTLFKTNKYYIAMGITKAGMLYGIATDGFLYRIDKEAGTETLIGPTGITLSDSSGAFFFQTGEIDQTDDTFYWLGTDQKKQSTSLYTVDLNTGAATEIYKFGQYTFSGMIIQQPKALGGAPAKVTDLSLMFIDGDTTGSVVFTAPTLSYDGQILNSNLSYKILVDGKETATGTTSPGKNETIPVTVSTDMHTFEVVTSNEIGSSPTTKLSKWIGYDEPQTASNIVMELDKQSGNAYVYWEAPVKGIHNGFIGSIYYDIYRIGNGERKLISENYNDTYIEDQITLGDYTNYKYGIVAKNGEQHSKMAFSNSEKLGSPFNVPYLEDFESADNFSIWTVVDVNNDRVESEFGTRAAWIYDNRTKSASYTFGPKLADDWLISPPIKLKAGKTYTIGLSAKGRSGQSKVYPERFEMKMGKGTNVENMTINVLPETNINSATYQKYENNQIKVDTDGDYHLGIHAISTTEGWTLYVDSIIVEQIPIAEAPDSVGNLKVIADSTGQLRTNIFFNAPIKTVGGTILTKPITKIELRRDNKIINTFNNVLPNTIIEYEDTKVSLGSHTYTVLPFIEGEQGRKQEAVVYVGVDIPEHVKNIKVADNDSSVKITWDKVGNTGVIGGLVIADNVDYEVWNTASYNGTMLLGEKLSTIHNGTSADIPFNTNEGKQGIAYWAVRAVNIAGAGEARMSGLLIGKAYSLPFKESVTKGQLNNYWNFNSTGGGVKMQISAEASDGDNYAFTIDSPSSDEYGELYSGKISLAGAEKPTLTLDVKGTDSQNTIGIYVVKPDGTETLADVISPKTGYTTYKIDLTQYKTERYIRLGLFETFNSPGNITFDNINIVDMNSYDLKVSDFYVPETVHTGDSAIIRLSVKNYGLQTAKSYAVRITMDNKELMNTIVEQPLPSMHEQSFETSIPTTIFDEAGSRVIKAEIIYAIDEIPENNIAERILNVLISQAVAPENLLAEQTEKGIKLTWNAPHETTRPITEDFEDENIFVPFSLGGVTETTHEGSFGDWKIIDGDGQVTDAWGAVTYKNSAKPHAWQVINPETVFGANIYDKDKAHSGNQYLISFCPVKGAANDWLISPELPGVEQTITFYVKCLSLMYGDETYEVLYSTTDRNIESFIKVENTENPNMDWTQRFFTLPNKTKYFAIHHTATDAFGLLLDDINYSVKGDKVKKYNIYLDKKLIATVEGENTTYIVNRPLTDGDHLFSVTAIYGDNIESAPVSIRTAVSIIDSPHVSNQNFTIYTVSGKLVRKNSNSIKGLRGVYIIDGKKIMIR